MELNWKPRRRFHNFHFGVIRFYMFSISFAVIHRFLWKIVRANLREINQSVWIDFAQLKAQFIQNYLFDHVNIDWCVKRANNKKCSKWKWSYDDERLCRCFEQLKIGLWKWNDWRRNIQSIAKFLQALCNGYKVNVGIHTCADKSAADRIYAHCH